MLGERFSFLSKHCVGHGLEFGEDASAVTTGRQFRQASYQFDGQRSEQAQPAQLKVPDRSQDFVCCVHYLEHFPDPVPVLKEWWRVLADGGVLVIALPEAGLYPRVGERDCNPDHKVDFQLENFKQQFLVVYPEAVVVDEGFDCESFYVVLQKGTALPCNFVTPKYSVVIPFYKHQTMTAQCVESIFKHCQPDEVICVNDGSARPIDVKGVRNVKLGRNYGFPRAVNEGVKNAKNEFVVVLNNDTIINPGGLERLVAALRDPIVGMAGQSGGKLNEDFSHKEATAVDPDYIEMFCCAFRQSVWKRVGPLDEGMGRGYGEDSDWGIRARKLGYKLVMVPNCCKHIGRQTFGESDDVTALIERNRQRLVERYYRGRALWVMASLGCNGGGKVVQKLAEAMQDDGWLVDVCSLVPWSEAAPGWERFGQRTQKDAFDKQYDVVISTFVSTMPFAKQVPCQHRLALIQSDEPEWPDNERERKTAREHFTLPGFKHVIIADHMRSFDKKYGMDIVGQLDNGVDSLVFTPRWTMHRDWPHRIMVVWKGAKVWFDGQEYLEQAIPELHKKYHDLEVLVLGSSKPRLACHVENVKTFDPDVICDMYNRSTCLVVPSLIEGSSLVPLEAMSSGLPVISTQVGMHYAKDGEDYLQIPYRDSGAIVQAVNHVFDDEKLRKRLYLNGLKLAHSRTWENEQAQWLSLLKKEMTP